MSMPALQRAKILIANAINQQPGDSVVALLQSALDELSQVDGSTMNYGCFPYSPDTAGWPSGMKRDADGRYTYKGHALGPGADDARALRWAQQIDDRERALDPNNPTGEEATVDVPGVGFVVMEKAEVDRLLVDYDAAQASGNDYAFWQTMVGGRPDSDLIRQALQNRGMTRAQFKERMAYADAHRGQQ